MDLIPTLSEVVELKAEKIKNCLKKKAAQKAAIRASNKLKGLKEKRYPPKKLLGLGPDDRARVRAKQKVRDERRKTLKNAVSVEPVLSNLHVAPPAVVAVLPHVVDPFPVIIESTKAPALVIELSDDDDDDDEKVEAASSNGRNDHNSGRGTYSGSIEQLAQFGIVEGLDKMHRLYISINLDSPICSAGTVVLDKLCWNPNPFAIRIGCESPGRIISSARIIVYKCRVWHS